MAKAQIETEKKRFKAIFVSTRTGEETVSELILKVPKGLPASVLMKIAEKEMRKIEAECQPSWKLKNIEANEVER